MYIIQRNSGSTLFYTLCSILDLVHKFFIVQSLLVAIGVFPSLENLKGSADLTIILLSFPVCLLHVHRSDRAPQLRNLQFQLCHPMGEIIVAEMFSLCSKKFTNFSIRVHVSQVKFFQLIFICSY